MEACKICIFSISAKYMELEQEKKKDMLLGTQKEKKKKKEIGPF